MSDLKEPGFKASEILSDLGSVFATASEKERKDEIRKTNAIFAIQVKNSEGKEAIWVIDLKKEGSVTKGEGTAKPDVTIILSDTFVDLANGKTNGQKAFLTGKLKTKGNMMLATKLEGVLATAKNKKSQKSKL